MYIYYTWILECRYTSMNKIGNENIKKKVGVVSIEGKLWGTRLRWYEHVHRWLIDASARQCENMINTHINRERRRSKKTWLAKIQQIKFI